MQKVGLGMICCGVLCVQTPSSTMYPQFVHAPKSDLLTRHLHNAHMHHTLWQPSVARMRDVILDMKRTTTRLGSLIAGLGTLASISPSVGIIRYPHRSDAEALRGDAIRIGGDMQRVIDRERALVKASPK